MFTAVHLFAAVTLVVDCCLIYPAGAIYSCLYPFWDYDQLHTNIRKCELRSTAFEILSEDSLQQKSYHLGVDANLSLSVLGGLVKVSGSASYMKDQKKSKHVQRVTLQYMSTTHHEQLSMDQLGHLTLSKFAFEKKLKQVATHVVVGVTYGADAFMVFDKTVTNQEDRESIHGKMKAAVKLVPEFAVNGSVHFKLNDQEKNFVKTFDCKFHGGVLLEQNPSTFFTAIKVYAALPSLVGEDGKYAVSKTAVLCPISFLISKEDIIYQEIHYDLITQAQSLMAVIDELDIEINTLNSEIEKCTHNLPYLVVKMRHVTTDFNKQKDDFFSKLSSAIIKVRSDAELATLLADPQVKEMADQTRSQLAEISAEVMVLKNIFGIFEAASPNIAYAYTQAEVDAFILDFNYMQVHCLEIQEKKPESSHPPGPWYTQPDAIEVLWNKAEKFASSASAGENDSTVKFILSTTIHPKKKCDAIDFTCKDYQLGKKCDIPHIHNCLDHDVLVPILNGKDMTLFDGTSTKIPLMADYKIPRDASAIQIYVKVEALSWIVYDSKTSSPAAGVISASDDAILVYMDAESGDHKKRVFFRNVALITDNLTSVVSNGDYIIVPYNGESSALLMSKALTNPLGGKAVARVTGYYKKDYGTHSITNNYHTMKKDLSPITIELPPSLIPSDASHVELYVEVHSVVSTGSTCNGQGSVVAYVHAQPGKQHKSGKEVIAERELFFVGTSYSGGTAPLGCNSTYLYLPVTNERKVYLKLNDPKAISSLEMKCMVSGYRKAFPFTFSVISKPLKLHSKDPSNNCSLHTMDIPSEVPINALIEFYVTASVTSTWPTNSTSLIKVYTLNAAQKVEKEVLVNGFTMSNTLFNSAYVHLPVTSEKKAYIIWSYQASPVMSLHDSDGRCTNATEVNAVVKITGYSYD